MNTYLIPTTAAYCYEPYDYIYFVYADTPQEAYIKACTKLQGEYIPLESQEYESFHLNCTSQMIQLFFHSMNQENMIYLQKHLKIQKEQNIWRISM